MKATSKIIISLCSLFGLITCDVARGSDHSVMAQESCGRPAFTFKKTMVAWCKAEAYCAGSSDEVEVCACQDDPESAIARIRVDSGAELVKEYQLEMSGMFFADDSFRLDAFGRDFDGNRVYLLSVMDSVSNGMGVDYWKTAAISKRYATPFVDVEEYGSLSFAETLAPKAGSCDAVEGECRLLVSRWVEGHEAGRGAGLYLAGVWFRLYTGGEPELSVDYEMPALSRRYLYSFQRARGDGTFRNARQKWYKSKAAHETNGPYPFLK